MTEEEFIDNAIKVSMDIGLTYEQAEAIAKLTVILEKNNLQREFFDSIYHNKNRFRSVILNRF